MGYVYYEVKDNEAKQDGSDGKQNECESAPEADVVLQPVDVLGVVLFQGGQLCNVLAFGVGELLPEGGYVGFRLGCSQLCCGELQISGGQLVADIG